MSRRQQLFSVAVTTAYLCLFVATANPQADDKWSRQLEATGPGQADSYDWVPLAQPVDDSSADNTKDRSANGRVLTYSQAFPPDGRFGNIPKPHNGQLPQRQGFDFPYQFQRFANAPQPQTLRQHQSLKSSGLQPQEPTSQSFFKFEMPFHTDGHHPANGPSSLQTGYQIQHTFGGGGAQATLYNSQPLYNQNPVFPPEFHPVPPKPQQQPLQQQKPLHQQNFIEDTFPLKNSFRESSKPGQHTLDSLQAVTPQVFPADPQPESLFELRKPSSFQASSPFLQNAPSAAPAPPPLSSIPSSQSNPAGQSEDVQLLYVPYETLYNQQQRPTGPPSDQSNAFEVNKFNLNPGLPAVNPYQINQFYTQDPFESNFYATTTTHRPYTTSTTTTTTNKPVFQNFNSNQQYTTQKPKPKAHQPPLAMFLQRNSARPTQADVVSILRNANTISVLDAPTKQTPEIFVGPSGMPIPNGYVKFDLPYLSQLSQPRDLRDVSFFVAPLSYRTPNGFNKILLPEPHVGSIVINRAKDNYADTQQSQQPQQTQQQPPQNTVYITPNQNEYIQNSYQSSTPRTRTSTHRPKPQQTSAPKNYYQQDVLREPSLHQKNRNPFETTTHRGVVQQPSRGNKFNYFYDQDAIQEVTSPKITKQDRPKKKRPQVVQLEQPVYPQKINNPYAQFQPMPNQIVTDDYYKLETTRPTTTSTSTSTTSTTTTSTTPAPTFYQYTTNPQIEYQSANGQIYQDFTTAPREPEEYVTRYTTRPPTATTAEEEYRMKQYFRQQNAFRNRPQLVSSTNPPFEYVNYTPAGPEYETPAFTQRPTTHKQRVTYYTPTSLPSTPNEEEPLQTQPPQPEYNLQETQTDNPGANNLPINHRPSYNQNEILDGTVEYEPNPYQLPSELPPLTANLPGLVNDLQEQDKQQANEQNAPVTPTYSQEQSTSSTRRPNRTRKPVIAKVSSSVSYSESESPSKRPTHRIRRPYGSRTSATPASAATASYEDDNHSSTTTTRRPPASRTSIIRNPNRVRYQPTPEERQTLRLKPRKKYTGSNKVKESEDLDYQRDVLKQNYPVFRPAGSARRPTSPTATPTDAQVETTTDRYTSESQQIYTVTPSNNIDANEQTFPAGLLEPMQIAQQYNHYSKDNYGPGYFPNQEDLIPTEPIGRNEIHPVYSTTPSTTTTTTATTTTTEEPTVTSTTRRSPFIRRNYPRLRATTTEAPTPTTASTDERQTARPRIPPRKVIKVRARTRRPAYQASTTSAPDDYVEQQEEVEPKNNYRKLNRFNQDLYENDTPRRRYKQQFHLDGQESQWSAAVKTADKNAFKPVDPEEEQKENTHNFDAEPEIITADSEHDQANENPTDTYEIKVSANLNSPSTPTKAIINEPNLKPEKSFAELLEEVMGKAPEETTTESELTSRTTDGTFFESQKTAISNRINRRGKWKKVRTSPSRGNNGESFETAESQNLGAQLLNSLYAGEQKETKPEEQKQPKTTTPLTPSTTAVPELTTISAAVMTTTPTPQTTMDEYDMTTARIFDSTTEPTTLPMNVVDEAKHTTTTTMPDTETTEDSSTHRTDEYDQANADDLETQPSLFSEVKRQLHELFSIEESEDQALNGALVAVGRRRQEYTNIQRPKPESTTDAPQTTEATKTESDSKADDQVPFHKNLMEHVVYATATSTKVSSETEICYRGRCIRSEDLPPNHKLN